MLDQFEQEMVKNYGINPLDIPYKYLFIKYRFSKVEEFPNFVPFDELQIKDMVLVTDNWDPALADHPQCRTYYSNGTEWAYIFEVKSKEA